jgi:hypothetical protein
MKITKSELLKQYNKLFNIYCNTLNTILIDIFEQKLTHSQSKLIDYQFRKAWNIAKKHDFTLNLKARKIKKRK